MGGWGGGDGGEGQREKADEATLCLLGLEQKSYAAFFKERVLESGLGRVISEWHGPRDFICWDNRVIGWGIYLSLFFLFDSRSRDFSLLWKEERTRLSPGALQLLVGSLYGEGSAPATFEQRAVNVVSERARRLGWLLRKDP